MCFFYRKKIYIILKVFFILFYNFFNFDLLFGIDFLMFDRKVMLVNLYWIGIYSCYRNYKRELDIYKLLFCL